MVRIFFSVTTHTPNPFTRKLLTGTKALRTVTLELLTQVIRSYSKDFEVTPAQVQSVDKLLYATIDEIKNVIETKIFLQECLLDEFEKECKKHK